MNKIQSHEQEILEKFEEEFVSHPLSSGGRYSVMKPVSYSKVKEAISQALHSQMEVVREYFATYQLDLCENSERFRKEIFDFLTPHEEEKK